jgi:hypothetical protein
MDVDDGYILWTGIWKGNSLFILWDDSMHDSVIALLHFAALGNSKGSPSSGSDYGTWLTYRMLSRHSQDDRVPT